VGVGESMKTKNIPSIIMLLAGAITSIITYFNAYTVRRMLFTLLVVLVIFYILGLIVKGIMDYFISVREDKKDDEGKVIEKESDLTEKDKTSV